MTCETEMTLIARRRLPSQVAPEGFFIVRKLKKQFSLKRVTSDKKTKKHKQAMIYKKTSELKRVIGRKKTTGIKRVTTGKKTNEFKRAKGEQ